ncbi:integral membrane protein [Herbaspirillum sp. BH-1]|uniref:Cobalt transporter subunit CbtA n=1 Tax=Herbaspirillum frisingense TaxID=92645 RepID=A0ABU1PC10_9BURK|nr:MULTISPECIES: CbtA family protein [Herbaspirillum]MDR6582693.1 cobalt transporter subunit CbtA [Herbaspirillum frisingense]PLY58122.1 integral membrane protein [Herbaspirillum sp. BH-1]
MNWTVFRRMASAVVVAGALSGVLLSGVQQFQVEKIILQAEQYEKAAEEAAPAAAATHDHDHDAAPAHEHAAGTPAHSHGDAHEHDPNAWEPADGAERTGYTVLANVSMAVGFALMLVAAFAISGRRVGWRSGLLWGLAGYGVFFVAPSLGLPPEVPGTLAAPLHARQLWWVMTAVMTAASLGLFVFGRGWWWKVLAVLLLVVPHLVGAPQPELHGSAAPEELAQAFIRATAMANAVFWLALGGLTGFFYRRFG